jgi:hypothetical protein
LLVFAQGSEKWSHVRGAYQYLLAAQGIAFFAWDKRGTNHSGGTFTEDFEVLADDAAAAGKAASTAATGRYGRVGFLGGSQGGWVAPLASLKFPVDFIEVAFGVAGSPVEQDQWQVRYQLREKGVAAAFDRDIDKLTSTTATLVTSDVTAGASKLRAIEAQVGPQGWLPYVDGQYSGQVLRGDVQGVRAENPGLMWNYDALSVLRRVKVPQLWIMAGDDSVAPSANSIARLQTLQRECFPLDIYAFPHADHGIHTYVVNSQGQRVIGEGYATGYMELVAAYALGAEWDGSGQGYWAEALRGVHCSRPTPSASAPIS